MGEFVRVDVQGGIATIRIDRPKVNALSVQVKTEIGEAAVRVSAEMAARSVHLGRAFTAVAEIPQPVVAAITGYALGGGLELALCADLRVLGENAEVGQPEIMLGIIPGAGGTQRLPRLVGPAKAKDLILIFTGRRVSAAEALTIGLADLVVPDRDVYQAARDLAARCAVGPALACPRRGPR